MEHGAVVAEGDFGEQREVFVQQGHDLVGSEPLRHAGEAAQVGEEDDGVSAHLGSREQGVAQLRVLQDLVREAR